MESLFPHQAGAAVERPPELADLAEPGVRRRVTGATAQSILVGTAHVDRHTVERGVVLSRHLATTLQPVAGPAWRAEFHWGLSA
ncbi:hypothetical protein D3C76_1326000 [compost metagenome]